MKCVDRGDSRGLAGGGEVRKGGQGGGDWKESDGDSLARSRVVVGLPCGRMHRRDYFGIHRERGISVR